MRIKEPGLAAIATGILVFILLVYGGHVLLDVLAPDPCAFHNGRAESGWMFDLFFPMTASSGFHPEPGLVFHATTLCCGVGAGMWANSRFAARST